MKNIPIKLTGLLFVLLLTHTGLHSQTLQTTLFDDVNRSMQMAKQAQADVLSPRTFEEAMGEYNTAKKKFEENGELAEIRSKIDKAESKFQEATENTKVSAVMFSSALSARRDAINAESAQFEKEMWMNAEKEMKGAAEQLERGDSDDAKEMSVKAADLYRKAELESIKANYLTNAKKLLEKADDTKVDKVAPKTLAEARSLVSKAEKELLDNRYDTDQARYLAKQAEYKALLAIHIAKEEKVMDDKDFETEDYLLLSYEPIAQIGERLNLNLKFDKGMDAPVSEIINTISIDQQRLANLESTVYNQQMTNENLTAQLVEQQKILETMKGTLSDEAIKGQKRQSALQSRIDRMAEVNVKFEQVQQIFNKDEAQVFRQKNDVIIRLIGVNFDIGKSQIKQEDYELLARLQTAMNLFNNASTVIEGHTDSQGSDDQNLKLSQERADALLSYLNANSTTAKAKLTTKGYGESKPVANNETADGRTMNRRIDIVIKPDFEDILMGSVVPITE